MQIKNFFDQTTNTMTYIVYDNSSKDAVIIDPVLNFDYASGKIFFESNQLVENFLKENNLIPLYIFETHVHADHMSGAHYLKQSFPQLKIAISNRITEVQNIFAKLYNDPMPCDGREFDLLLSDGQVIQAGSLEFKVIATPGHTPACTSFLIGEHLFTGDTLFMPDFGTGRCDFPAGSAQDLYHSIHEILYKLPDNTQVYVGHDYGTGGREIKYQTSIGECKETSVQLKQSTTKEDFVQFRTSRDQTLNAPKLLLPSLQVNINAGKIPAAAENTTSYLKIPLSIVK